MQSKPEVPQRWSLDWWLDVTTGTGVPSGVNPLQVLLEFQSITGADKNSWRDVYGLIWNQVRRRATDGVCLRYIRRLCQRYGSISETGKVQPQEVANLDADIRSHLVLLKDIPAFIKNQRGSQHENVVRYIYGKYFMWFGRTRFQIDVMNSTTIKEENKKTYWNVMKTLLLRVKNLLEMIKEDRSIMEGERIESVQRQDQALTYFR